MLLDQAPPDRLRQVGQGERRQRRPGFDLGAQAARLRLVEEQSQPLVPQPVDQRRCDRRFAHRQAREPPEHVGRHLAQHRPAGVPDPPGVPAEPPVAGDQEGKPKPRVRPPPPHLVVFGRRVEPRFVGLHDPQQPVAVEIAVGDEPLVVAGDAGLGRRIADRDSPRPGQERRLDRPGHRVRARADVVVEAATERDRVIPEDHVTDEPVGPAGAKQRFELRPGAARVEAAPDDRREARVPVPLPGIARRARAGVGVADAPPLALRPARAEYTLGEC